MRALIALAACALAGDPAWAQGAPSCHDAAVAAERESGVPERLLDAIGAVESGRFDAARGRVEAWPFAVNAAGEGHLFATLEDAVAFVRERQRGGVRSIDVGCFQVNLMHHPDAFATLEEAFDPAANAGYAARFLAALRARAGDWAEAVGLYHSATPALGAPYRDQVLARWQGHEAAGVLARGPAAGGAFDPFVVSLARSSAVTVRVWVPGGGGAAPGLAHIITATR
jgi:soluble lytic murein transglycosylase-like protein